MKTLIVAMLLAVSTPAFAQVTWQAGPTIPLLLIEPGTAHPVSVVPGAGLQLSLSMQQFQRAFWGKSYDLFDLDLMAFGSLVKATDDTQFGQLSVAVAACTMSGLFCLGGGKHLLTNEAGFEAGKTGWFFVFSFSFNFAGSLEAPPLGIAPGAAGLVRGNTIYFQ